MMIAAAAAGASLLQDALSSRKSATPNQPEQPAQAEARPARHGHGAHGLDPAAAQRVSGSASMLLGVQAGGR